MAKSNRGQNIDQENHYTEKQTLNNMNPIKHRGWIPKGQVVPASLVALILKGTLKRT